MNIKVARSQVALDDQLVLLLVSSTNDQVVLRADKPQELLKPTTIISQLTALSTTFISTTYYRHIPAHFIFRGNSYSSKCEVI